MLGTPLAAASSIAACIFGIELGVVLLAVRPLGIVPPGRRGYIDGTSPYFFRIGQSAGPIRS